MLKRIPGRLKFLFVVVCCPVVALAYLPTTESATPEQVDQFSLLAPVRDWSWDGKLRLQADLDVDQKPSSVSGKVQTEWGSLEFANTWTNDHEPFQIGMAGHFGPERDSSTGQPQFEWDEARFTWRHRPELSFGVLMEPVVAFDLDTWRETSLGNNFRSGVDRWNILPHSDLGLQLAQPTSIGRWTLQITNGDGWPHAETGTHQDFELLWDHTIPDANAFWRAQVFYRYGSYDQLDPSHDTKQRYGLQLGYLSPSWNLGIVALGTQDAVDGMTANSEGDGVDLSAKGGQEVTGELTEFWLRYIAGDSPHKWRFLLRSALFRPDTDDADKDIQSFVMGAGKELGSGMQVDLLFQQESFGPTHSKVDQQRWFLAWVWGLERTPEKPAL